MTQGKDGGEIPQCVTKLAAALHKVRHCSVSCHTVCTARDGAELCRTVHRVRLGVNIFVARIVVLSLGYGRPLQRPVGICGDVDAQCHRLHQAKAVVPHCDRHGHVACRTGG